MFGLRSIKGNLLDWTSQTKSVYPIQLKVMFVKDSKIYPLIGASLILIADKMWLLSVAFLKVTRVNTVTPI